VIGRWNRIARKSLRRPVEFIERLIASDPKRAIAIFEETFNNYPIEAVGISRIANEHFEGVAIVPVQSISCSKPHETLVVLHDLIRFYLR
jgi:hypothetical protein